MKKFNVLEYNWSTRKKSEYDVLPYFRNVWKSKSFNFEKKDVKNKNDLKNWIKRTSQYHFWSRCEYEFLMCPWPYNEGSLKNDLYKIDVHEQIMMNIDIITDILSEEFKIL